MIKRIIQILVILSISNVICAQVQPNPGDSLFFDSIKNDIIQLRETTNQLGTWLALKSHLRLGSMYFQEEDYSAAKGDFEILRNSYGTTEIGKEASYFLGRIASIEGNAQQAKQLFEEYEIDKPYGEFIEADKFHLIKELVKLEEPSVLNEVSEFFSEYQLNSEYSDDVQNEITLYYAANSDYSNAIIEGNKLLQSYQESEYCEDMQWNIGDYHVDNRQYSEAKQYFQSLLSTKQPDTKEAAIAQYLLGWVSEVEGNLHEAREEYSKVNVNNPSVSEWGVLGEYSKVMTFYKEWTNLPDSLNLELYLQEVEIYLDNYPNDRNAPRVLINSALVYSKIEDYEHCLEQLELLLNFNVSQILNVEPDRIDDEIRSINRLKRNARLKKANIFRNKILDYELAMIEYDIVLAEDQFCGEALLGKAGSLMNLGINDNAIPLLTTIIENDLPEKEAAEIMLSKIQ